MSVKTSGRPSWAVPGLAAAALAQVIAALAGAALVVPPSTWSRAPARASASPDGGRAPAFAPVPTVAGAGATAVSTGAKGGARTGARGGPARSSAAPLDRGPVVATAVITPPFGTGTRVAGCFPPGPQCSTATASRPEDGFGEAAVAVTSPGQGALPGVGSAQAYAGVIAEIPITAPARRAVITAIVDVARNDVGHEVGPLGVPALGSKAQLVLQEVAIHSVCGGWGCFATSLSPLASLDDGRGPLLGSPHLGQRRLRVVVTNPSGLMPAGVLSVAVQVFARAELGNMSAPSPDVGTVHAAAAFRVERIEATVT